MLQARSSVRPLDRVEFKWEVDNFSVATINMAAATDTLRSPRFAAFGFEFSLEIQPNTRRIVNGVEGDKEIGVFVSLGTPATSIPAHFSIDLGSYRFVECFRTFSTVVPQPADTVPSWGALIAHSSITAAPGRYLNLTGKLHVKVVLTRVGLGAAVTTSESRPAERPRPTILIPASTITSELMQGLLGRRGCPFDVVLLCTDGERVPAHSFVLCLRSTVFAALLSPASGLAPVNVFAVPVHPEVTSATLQRLLEFLYTDHLTPSSPEEARTLPLSGVRLHVILCGNEPMSIFPVKHFVFPFIANTNGDDKQRRKRPQAQHLLHAADHYELARLKAICEKSLCDQLSVRASALQSEPSSCC